MCACSSGTATVGEKSDSLPPIFPDYVGVTVPCNIAPLNFEVRGTDLIRAEFAVKGRNMLTVECRGGVVDIPIDKWREVLGAAAADSVQVRVSAWGPAQPEGVEYKPFSFYVSPDSIDGWAAYRLIEPSYEGWMQMGIYQRDLSTFEEKVLGHAEVRQTFKASGVGTIAGAYVKDGIFERNCSVRLIRDGIVVFDGPLASLKRFKDDVKEVRAGYECGFVFENYNDIKEGDEVEAYKMVETERK